MVENECAMRHPQVNAQFTKPFSYPLEEGPFKSVVVENIIPQTPSFLVTPTATSAVQVEPLSYLPTGSGTSV